MYLLASARVSAKLYFIIIDGNIFGFWVVGYTKYAVLKRHLGSEGLVTDMFLSSTYKI